MIHQQFCELNNAVLFCFNLIEDFDFVFKIYSFKYLEETSFSVQLLVYGFRPITLFFLFYRLQNWLVRLFHLFCCFNDFNYLLDGEVG